MKSVSAGDFLNTEAGRFKPIAWRRFDVFERSDACDCVAHRPSAHIDPSGFGLNHPDTKGFATRKYTKHGQPMHMLIANQRKPLDAKCPGNGQPVIIQRFTADP